MRIAGCLVLEHCGSRSPILSCRQYCEVLLGRFRVCDSEQVQQVGFLFADSVVRCCSEGLGFVIPSKFNREDLWNSDLCISRIATSESA
jgi:hypothetical protein